MCVCHLSPFLGPPWLPHCFWEVTFQRLSHTEVQVALILLCVSFHNPFGGSSCYLYSDPIGWSPVVLLGDKAGVGGGGIDSHSRPRCGIRFSLSDQREYRI